MNPTLLTLIPDEVIVTLLSSVAAGAGIAISFLWNRMNKLSDTVAALKAEVGIYRHCPYPACPLADVRHDFKHSSNSGT